MHIALLAAVLGLIALRSVGVGIPIWASSLVLLACPLMMVWMLVGMDHGAKAAAADPEHQPDRHEVR